MLQHAYRKRGVYSVNTSLNIISLAYGFNIFWRGYSRLLVFIDDIDHSFPVFLILDHYFSQIGISNATLAKLGKNEPVNLKIIESICRELQCGIEDVVETTP